MNKFFAIGIFLAATMIARGTSYIFPTYSTPILADGTLIVLSPDRTLLLGVTQSGKQKWKQRLASRGSIYKYKSGKVLLIVGTTASGVNPRSGAIELIFDAKSGVSNLQYEAKSDIFFGETESWGSPALIVYDGTTHVSLLKQKHGETIAYADQEIIVLAKGKRKKEKDGYSYSKGWMEAFSRKTGKQMWSADFKNEHWPYHSTCRVGEYVVCEDGDDLMVIHAVSGKLKRSPADKPLDSIGPSGIKSENGALVYVASELNYSDFNRSKQTIYRVSIPDLKTIEARVVEIIEAARAETSGNFIISDSLYRTACFHRDGRKIWERFQMHRTGVVDGMIYFSDYDKGVARMGSVEVSTGKEKILISEKVEMNK